MTSIGVGWPAPRDSAYTQRMQRNAIIELLNYPRRFVTGQLTSTDCGHGWNYSDAHEDCRDCWHSLACDWLQHNDECIDWHSRSLDELLAALETALGQVDSHLHLNGHDRRSCRCDTCNWFRRAHREYLLVVDQR